MAEYVEVDVRGLSCPEPVPVSYTHLQLKLRRFAEILRSDVVADFCNTQSIAANPRLVRTQNLLDNPSPLNLSLIHIYGAKYMAEQGYDYTEILAHYYPNTELRLESGE